MFVYLYLVKKVEVSKRKKKHFVIYFLVKFFITFLTKFKNCECNILGPIFCKSSKRIFNIGLLDSLNVVTVRERISQSF
jgi:hypothetical protein